MPLTPEQIAEADGFAAQGYGGRLIAAALDVPYGRVRRYLEKRRPPDTRPTSRPATSKPTFRTLVVDLECTNLKSDLGMVLCVAFYNMADGTIEARTIDDFGDRRGGEKALVQWAATRIEGADCLIGFNSTGFDTNYLNGVLTRHGLPRLPKRLHIDLYQTARNGWKGIPSSYSLRNLSVFFGLPEQKESLDKEDWRTALSDPGAMVRLREHCEADVRITALLWERMKTFFFDWRGR